MTYLGRRTAVLDRTSVLPKSLTRALKPSVERALMEDSGPMDGTLVVIRNYYQENSSGVGPVGILIAIGPYDRATRTELEGVTHVEFDQRALPLELILKHYPIVTIGRDNISHFVAVNGEPLRNRSRVPYRLCPITADEYEWFREEVRNDPEVAIEEMYELLSEVDRFDISRTNRHPKLILPGYYASLWVPPSKSYIS